MSEHENVIKAFAGLLAEADENERNAFIARAKMLAMNEAAPEKFEPPVSTLGEYLATPIPVPPILVEPALVVRGGITCTIGRAGKGKEQPYYAKLLTPTGWTTMGKVDVGDVLVNPDGYYQTVEGKFPQGVRTVYQVVLSDGSKTDVGAEHLWSVLDRHGKPRIVTTFGLRPGFAIETVSDFDYADNLERPLDPWIVGFLLGDGALSGGTVAFSTADAEIVRQVANLLPTSTVRHIANYDYGIAGGLVLDHVRQLGMDVVSRDKRVPTAYLQGTAVSRLEVLRGLMDSDGHASGQFCSMSKGLVEDVIELTRSLGGSASLHAQRPNGAWRTVVSLPANPFSLTRKASQWSKTRLIGKRYVVSVDKVGVPVEQFCIKVSGHNQLYVTDDFIVTHNTQMNLNRIMRWSVGKPMFEGLKNKEDVTILGPSKPLRVLMIENEGAAGMFHRQVGIMLNAPGYLTEAEREVAKENILVWGDGGWSGLKLDDEQQLNMVRTACDKHKPDILFIEPFRGLWKGDENSATDMAIVADALSGVAADFDCGVVLTHHERKSGAGDDGEKMSAGRGSTVLEGVVATMENFEAVKAGEYRELTWSKVRYGGGHAILPVRMEWQPGDWWYAHVSLGAIEQTLLNELADADPEALTVKDLIERTDEKEYTVRRTLKALLASTPPKIKKMASVSTGSGSTGVRYRLVTPSEGEGGMDF